MEEKKIEPTLVERYADNGALSHYALVDKNSGELLWSENPKEELQRIKGLDSWFFVKESLSSKDLKEVFNKMDSFASIAVAIEEKYNCLIVPEEKWNSVTEALLDEVGVLGWKSKWDL